MVPMFPEGIVPMWKWGWDEGAGSFPIHFYIECEFFGTPALYGVELGVGKSPTKPWSALGFVCCVNIFFSLDNFFSHETMGDLTFLL